MNDKCKDCSGTGAVDSGASTPWGTFYPAMCSSCYGTGKASVFLIDWAASLIPCLPQSNERDRWLALATEFMATLPATSGAERANEET